MLRRLPTAAMLSALGHGLSVASRSERSQLAVELLELALIDPHAAPKRRRIADQALAEVVRNWSRLPDDVRHAAGSVGTGRWIKAAETALAGGLRERGSVALLAEHLAEPALGEPVLGLLGDESKEVAAAAERALLALALTLRPELEPKELEPEIERAPRVLGGQGLLHARDGSDRESRVLAVLAEAAWHYPNHRRKGVLLAAVLAMARIEGMPAGKAADRLARLLAEGNHPAGNGLRSVLRWSRAPAVRLAALVLLRDKPISGPCLDRLSRAESLAEHEAVLCHSHLLLRAERQRRLRRIEWRAKHEATAGGSPALRLPDNGLAPDAQALASLTEPARRGLPRLVATSGTDPITRRVALEPLLADPDALTRHGTVRVAPEQLVLDFCFDESPAVARSAVLRWSALGVPGVTAPHSPQRVRTIHLLARSPHASVRALAKQEASRLTSSAITAGSVLAVRRRLERDPDGTLGQLSAMMASGEPGPVVEAISIARRLGIEPRLESALVEVARTPLDGAAAGMERAAASAAMALGRLDSPASLRALHFCLSHQDRRVRANAVEALARRARRPGEQPSATRTILVELKADADHRVRANALRGLFEQAGQAVEPKPGLYESSPVASLLSMLSDDRQQHRRAALWLVSRVARSLGEHALAVGGRVQHLAQQEPDDEVRANAQRSAKELAARARDAWTRRAGVL